MTGPPGPDNRPSTPPGNRRGRARRRTSWTAESFLSGMSLTWLFLPRFGVDVGIAFGDSDLLGTVVVAAVYLYLV